MGTLRRLHRKHRCVHGEAFVACLLCRRRSAVLAQLQRDLGRGGRQRRSQGLPRAPGVIYGAHHGRFVVHFGCTTLHVNAGRQMLCNRPAQVTCCGRRGKACGGGLYRVRTYPLPGGRDVKSCPQPMAISRCDPMADGCIGMHAQDWPARRDSNPRPIA